MRQLRTMQQYISAKDCEVGARLCYDHTFWLGCACMHAHCIASTYPAKKKTRNASLHPFPPHPPIFLFPSVSVSIFFHSYKVLNRFIRLTFLLRRVSLGVRFIRMPVQQIIEDRYIDARRLQDLLAHKFHRGTFSMTVSNCIPVVG